MIFEKRSLRIHNSIDRENVSACQSRHEHNGTVQSVAVTELTESVVLAA